MVEVSTLRSYNLQDIIQHEKVVTPLNSKSEMTPNKALRAENGETE